MLQNVLSVALLLSSASASCLHGTSLMPRRLNGRATVEVATYGYDGANGPLNWHNLAPANSMCATGKNQSPINLGSSIKKAAKAPVIEIPNVQSAEFENLGSTLEVIVNGTTTVDGRAFELAQFHLHTPSEHRINDEYYPLEMHMVHQAADGDGFTVLGLMFELSEDGSTTELLTSMNEVLADVTTPGSITQTGALDFKPIVKHLTSTPLLSYSGSLTTPPCSEGINFLISQTPMAIDVKTFNALKGVMKFNSRVSQNVPGQDNLLGL
ncbi:Monooxygenase FAD-binding protein [Macrophomina phaseolina MS6]|uniref:Carbonic anhydrase n=1 Tax=Macrophomina phaseolina (strain MS6) TaxID=1126212 RepID=K2RK00_MACPH|nr:Monooxygenase FAD-binding protein [Macrophomina phaseolina MS6]